MEIEFCTCFEGVKHRHVTFHHDNTRSYSAIPVGNYSVLAVM